MTPYRCSNYKDVLKESIALGRGRSNGRRPTFQAMAEHCRVQKTYLSKVLNHDVHLSEDQLFLALDFLSFDDDAREFTHLLMAWEKSQIPSRRDQLEKKLKKIRSEKLKTESNLDVNSTLIQATDLTAYFLDPMMQVVHMYLTIKKFSMDPNKIAELLHLRPQSLHKYFRSLESMGLIRTHASRGKIDRIEIIRKNLHLPQESILQSSYASRMRLKAIERMDVLDSDEAYRFSVIFSADTKTRERIHASFMEWLKGAQKQVQASREEEVYQMNFDLLNWT